MPFTSGAESEPFAALAEPSGGLDSARPASVQRTDVARHIAQQIAQQTLRASDGPAELQLDPQELGRVTLRLATEDAGVTLHVTAERAETSELMRRHIAMLQDSFRALGYERIEISINGRQAGGGFSGQFGSGQFGSGQFGSEQADTGPSSQGTQGGSEGNGPMPAHEVPARPAAGRTLPPGLAPRDTIDIRV